MKTIELELTNICLFNCISCSRKKFQNYGFLDIYILDSIISFIIINKYERIILAGFGDVFLHKDFFFILLRFFIKIKGIKIFIYTKGNSLSIENIKKIKNIVNRGYDLEIIFSLFSFNEKDYNILTGGLFGYKQIFKKMLLLKQNKLKISTELLLTSYSVKDLQKYYMLCKSLSIYPAIQRLINWGGELDVDIYNRLSISEDKLLKGLVCKNKRKFKTCEFLFNDFYQINYRGDIFKCCFFEYDTSLSLGNIKYVTSIQKLKGESKLKNRLYLNRCKNCLYYSYNFD
ncbi:MAG: hypothetical protein PHE25_01615 [Candidatus Gracilibacteria bacterium]|nr:hypothetical protein [Candidatus Gracilibacteria bacterium]